MQVTRFLSKTRCSWRKKNSIVTFYPPTPNPILKWGKFPFSPLFKLLSPYPLSIYKLRWCIVSSLKKRQVCKFRVWVGWTVVCGDLMRFGVGFDCAVGRVLGKQGTTLYNKTLAIEPTLLFTHGWQNLHLTIDLCKHSTLQWNILVYLLNQCILRTGYCFDILSNWNSCTDLPCCNNGVSVRSTKTG